MKHKKDLEETLKEKVSPLLDETMKKSWGVAIPKMGTDLTDQLSTPLFDIYVPLQLDFKEAKKQFKKQFLKRELHLHVGNVSQLAKFLGIDRRSVHRVIKDLDIKMAEMRDGSEEQYKQDVVDQALRGTLQQYKEIIQPQKMENIYQEIPALSRNIAKLLPHHHLTWKEAEREFERQFLKRLLEEQEGSISTTAKKAALRPETLHRKLKKLGLR
ncbi:hypothetical protein COV20_01040 [Candidatus Woesearchaeota archaeon CG10_big_fil_rev_8_21_14_0_10_45_16]|nr:MAG: hypothetical protein COV20_01040 [Candidatus Woesearchaeota archaeon CG10_big_fil_rev_8_21_14_0_10_45_16]